MHRLHIVHVLEKNRLTTGSVVQMLEAARGLGRRGHRATVISRPGGELEEQLPPLQHRPEHCRETAPQLLTMPLRSPFDLRSAWLLRRFLTAHPTHIVHVHKGRAHGLALWAAAGLGALPVLVVNRGVSFPLDVWNRWKYRHPRVGAVVCVAEAVRRVVLAGTGADPALVHTIHSGTDVSRFDPLRVDRELLRRSLGVERRQLLIGQVSVRDGKGWQDLLAAFSQVLAGRPQARLLLVGCEPAPVSERVMAAAAEHGVAGALLPLPYRQDMPELLAACDVVVDASWSGTGITGVVREAMAMERAVVATDCAGNRELVRDGEVGLLVPPREVASLAAALQRLLADSSLRRDLGRAARRRIVAGFTTEHRLDRLEALYRSLVARRTL